MTFKRILCCVDFSSNAESAFKASLDMAVKYGSTLHLLHVLPPVVNPLITDIDIVVPEANSAALVPKVEAKMQEVYAGRIDSSMNYVISVKDGHVSSEILNYLLDETIDLVILGAYGLSGVELVLFGSVAKRIAHKAPCSVMIVREQKQ